MQAYLRTLGGEVARGVSTAAVVWAGSGPGEVDLGRQLAQLFALLLVV